jgi:acetyl-CoA synthetase
MMPELVWEPPERLLLESNVARFMAAEHIDDFPTLVQRSIDDPEWFWDATVRFLELPFDQPYGRVLDTSDGIPWAKWFVDGRCNVATICTHNLADDRVAIVWEGEEGDTREITGTELRAMTGRIAAGLAARGVGAGDAVGLFMPMIPRDSRRVARDRCARCGVLADLLGLRT